MHGYPQSKIILLLEEKLKQNNFLARAITYLERFFEAKITLGAEIEFYLPSPDITKITEILPSYFFINERGKNQYEYHINPLSDPSKFALVVESSISQIEITSLSLGLRTDFSPKPFKDDFGNALQIQISSESKKFQKNIDAICSSLCANTLKTFLAQAPCNDDYLRFEDRFMAPTHVSYGFDNRTCLYRINGGVLKRIEFRGPSPACNIYVLVSTVLNMLIKYTEYEEAKILDKTYGNSFDPQYKLDKIPENLSKSEQLFDASFYKFI